MATQQSSNFDPSAYGAVPLPQTSTQFNPQAYGAVPVEDSGSTPSVAAQGTPDILESLKNTASDIEQPFASVAATPVQIFAKMKGLPDPYSQGMPTATGNVPIAPATPAGFLQKVGQAAQIGTMALAPETTGALKTAAVFGGAGVANDVAAGITNGKQILRDGIWSSILGLGMGIGGNFFSHVGASEVLRTGVNGVNESAISNSSPELVSQYINAAKNHGETLESLGEDTPVGIMEGKFMDRANDLTDRVIPQAGEAVGKAKAAAANLPLVVSKPGTQTLAGVDAVNALTDDINQRVMQMTGHGFGEVKDGTESLPGLDMGEQESSPVVYRLPGRDVVLSSKEEGQLQDLHGYLQRLQSKPLAGTASDILTNIDRDIGNWNTAQFGSSDSPVQGALKYARGAINNAIKGASPELAGANATYSALMDLKSTIGSEAGKAGQSGALMMRRVLSGDQATGPGGVVPILNALDAATYKGTKLTDIPDLLSDLNNPTGAGKTAGQYVNQLESSGQLDSLIKNSVLGKWATDMFGNETTKQLFSKGVAEGHQMAQGGASIFGYPRQFVQNQINKVLNVMSPDPAQYALSVAGGSPISMNVVTRNFDKLLDAEIDTPVVGKLVSGVQDALKSIGVTGKNLEPAAKAIFKTWLMNRLTQPKPTGFPLQSSGVPNAILPTGVSQPQSGAPQSSSPLSTANTSAAVRSLTPANSGQAMSAQMRQGGASTMPNGMNLDNNTMSLT